MHVLLWISVQNTLFTIVLNRDSADFHVVVYTVSTIFTVTVGLRPVATVAIKSGYLQAT
jgi:uncharacterized protein Veg